MTEIQRRIENLPKGSIVVKHVNGKAYEYWQFYENGKQISRRVKGEELEQLRVQIEERKRLQARLKDEKGQMIRLKKEGAGQDEPFSGFIRIGEDLLRFAEAVRDYKRREIYSRLEAFVFGAGRDRVLILYGLRRTGKTTMIRQLILSMTDEMRAETAFVQVGPDTTLGSLHHDLRLLEKAGIRYVFIDEVTLMADFIEGAALLSDIFAASGMKIILSGTDSLGFMFAEAEQLYDRCEMLHTTFIPYREFENVLGIRGIDEYIRYGGTMSLGGIHYNETPFSSPERTNEYVDSAIARNIQHSLKYYQDEGHFRALYDLYEKNELTNAINRVIEDMNHRFTLDVMTRAFVSGDLGRSNRNLLKDRKQPTDILERIDTAEVTDRLRTLLEIRNQEEQSVRMTSEHIREIREYLEILDLIRDVDVVISDREEDNRKRTIFTQPGLRYAQAEALITSLMQDKKYRSVGVRERSRITERILNEIRGRMMEDMILLETKMAYPGKQVFVLQFAAGEIDMVVFDPESISCEIFEIKHSTEIAPEQYRHLRDPVKTAEMEKQYGTIRGKYVIYRGEDDEREEVHYRNAENYLRRLK